MADEMNELERKRQIAFHLRDAFGGTFRVNAYYDESEKSRIEIFQCADIPVPGLTSFGTIGLSEHSIGLTTQEGKQLRAELLGMCESDNAIFPNVLASCAFEIINDHQPCRPGAIFCNVISAYDGSLSMKHIYLTYPWWPEDLMRLDREDSIVLWLAAFPISDAELDYLEANGMDAFEDLLNENQPDAADLNRESMV